MDSPEASRAPLPSGARRSRAGGTLRALALVAGLAVAGAVAYLWWLERTRFERTENAFVQADIVSVSAQVEGFISEIMVSDNEAVGASEILLRLDPVDAKAMLDQSRADLSAAKAAVRTRDLRVELEQSLIQERAANLTKAKADAFRATAKLARYRKLSTEGWISQQALQNVQAEEGQAKATVAQAVASLEASRRSAAASSASREEELARQEAAAAVASRRNSDLSRTEVRSPIAGLVGARSIRLGQHVRPGVHLLSIVPEDGVYVVANLKETQIASVRVGQPVEVKADAYGGKVFHGEVESLAPATGSEFALMPVENASGNFTKVVQRIPVKIRLWPTPNARGALRPGMSVHVAIRTVEDEEAAPERAR